MLPNIVGGLIPCRFTAVIGSASGARGSKEPGSHPKLNVPLVALLTFLGSVKICIFIAPVKKKKMLENRPEDALVLLVETVELDCLNC